MNRQQCVRPGQILTAVVGIAAAVCVACVPGDEVAPEVPQVRWGACPEDVGVPELQCATVPVPVDYDEPEGASIDIMISRLAGTAPDKRRGVLLLNPGGPGGSGLAQAKLLVAQGLPAEVRDSYDLIGMDTRGIGHSAPVSCGFTAGEDYRGNIPPYAPDDAAVLAQAKSAEAVARRCAANDREGLLRQVSTANMARDLDRIRAALGEEKTNYLGYSYGASLGAAYASMFPDRADRIVLDSNYGDTHLDRDGMRRYALGMEQTFPDFARWVAERDDRFGLGRTPEDVRATYLALAERLDRSPAPGMDGAMFRLNTFVSLYSPASYEATAQGWQDLLRPTQQDAAPSDPAAPSPYDNLWSVFLAVTCNDVDWPSDLGVYRGAVAADRAQFPLFGAASANVLPCAFWPTEPSEPPVRVDADGPPGVLIAQNRRDPVTPLRGGELLDEKFGERSRLLRVDGSGHGVYVLGGDSCALRVTTDYLVRGTLPTEDIDCPAG